MWSYLKEQKTKNAWSSRVHFTAALKTSIYGFFIPSSKAYIAKRGWGKGRKHKHVGKRRWREVSIKCGGEGGDDDSLEFNNKELDTSSK